MLEFIIKIFLQLYVLAIPAAIIIMIIILANYKPHNKSKHDSDRQNNPKTETNAARNQYQYSYQPRYLLTKNEWYEYKKLKQYAATMGLQICPKVRLLDIVEPRKGEGNYMSLLGKIQSKHVDFVICDQDLHIKAILELDDNSHNQKDRQERDLFVDQVLQACGYTVIHTRSITETTLDPLKPTEQLNQNS